MKVIRNPPVDEAIHMSIFPISYFWKARITIGRDDTNIRCWLPISFGYLWKNTIQHLSFLSYNECHKIMIFLIREKKATHFSKAIIWIPKVRLRHFWKRLYTPIWTYSIQKTKQYIWLSQLFESKHKITTTQWLT